MKVLYTLLIILFQIQYSFCQILISDNKSFIDAEIFRFEDVKKGLIGDDSLIVFKKNNIPVTGVVLEQFSKKLKKHIHHSYYENGKFVECYAIDEKGKFSHRIQNDKYFESFGKGVYGVRDVKDRIIHRLGKLYYNDKSTDSKDVLNSIYVFDNNDELLFEMIFCKDTNYLCDVLFYKNNKNIFKKKHFNFPYEKDISFSYELFNFSDNENGLIQMFSLNFGDSFTTDSDDENSFSIEFYENGKLKRIEFDIFFWDINEKYEFYENGQIKSVISGAEDKRWYLNGQLEFDINSNPVFSWHENGNKSLESMPNGETHSFDENGNLNYISKDNGEVHYYDENGSLKYIIKDSKIIKDFRE